MNKYRWIKLLSAPVFQNYSLDSNISDNTINWTSHAPINKLLSREPGIDLQSIERDILLDVRIDISLWNHVMVEMLFDSPRLERWDMSAWGTSKVKSWLTSESTGWTRTGRWSQGRKVKSHQSPTGIVGVLSLSMVLIYKHVAQEHVWWLWWCPVSHFDPF